jgi:TIR domain
VSFKPKGFQGEREVAMPPIVFISYSHKDARWKDRLVAQLGILGREGLLETWHDGLIQPGADWLPEIEAALARARVAILIVSADFLNSEFIRRKEVPVVIELRSREDIRVIPVIARPCQWKMVNWLARLQARPVGGKSLEELTRVQAEKVLSDLAAEILRLEDGSGDANAANFGAQPLTSAPIAYSQAVPPESQQPQGGGALQHPGTSVAPSKPNEAGPVAVPPVLPSLTTSSPEVGDRAASEAVSVGAAEARGRAWARLRTARWLLSWFIGSLVGACGGGMFFYLESPGQCLFAGAVGGAILGILQWLVIVLFFVRYLSVVRAARWILWISGAGFTTGIAFRVFGLHRGYHPTLLAVLLSTLAFTLSFLFAQRTIFPRQRLLFDGFHSWRIWPLVLPVILIPGTFVVGSNQEALRLSMLFTGTFIALLAPGVELVRSLQSRVQRQ